MSIRDWIDPSSADVMIPMFGIMMLVAPFFGLAIGLCLRHDTGSRIARGLVGFAIGCLLSLACLFAIVPLVCEYWAG